MRQMRMQDAIDATRAVMTGEQVDLGDDDHPRREEREREPSVLDIVHYAREIQNGPQDINHFISSSIAEAKASSKKDDPKLIARLVKLTKKLKELESYQTPGHQNDMIMQNQNSIWNQQQAVLEKLGYEDVDVDEVLKKNGIKL